MTERALRLGPHWQKAFPASALGPASFTAQREPFRTVKFAIARGVSTENAASFLQAGAAAVSLGSAFARSPDQDIRGLSTKPSAVHGRSAGKTTWQCPGRGS